MSLKEVQKLLKQVISINLSFKQARCGSIKSDKSNLASIDERKKQPIVRYLNHNLFKDQTSKGN